MINNRQAGRRRGRGGQQQRPQGNSGARDTGNRIDNRSRGNAAQLLEKYKTLARDAQMSGDRVNTEYYLQFADHYFRVLAETRSRFEENRTPAPGGANTFQDDDTEYDDDGAPIVAESQRQNVGQQNNGQNHQGDRQPNNGNARDGQPERQANDRGERNDRNDRGDRGPQDVGRQDGNRPRRANGGANGGNGTYGTEGERYVREDRPREDRGNRNDGRNDGRDEGRGNRAERYQAEDRAHPQADAPAVEVTPVGDEPGQDAPRRRGRPRRELVAEAPEVFDSASLPPSLNISAVKPEMAAADETGEPEEKPRRRRGRPPASEATSA